VKKLSRQLLRVVDRPLDGADERLGSHRLAEESEQLEMERADRGRLLDIGGNHDASRLGAHRLDAFDHIESILEAAQAVIEKPDGEGFLHGEVERGIGIGAGLDLVAEIAEQFGDTAEKLKSSSTIRISTSVLARRMFCLRPEHCAHFLNKP
jgi:hypothetical protein